MQTMGLEYMKMYARFIVRQKYIAMFGRFILYRSEYPPLGTQAYILSKNGARKMLGQFRKNRVLDMPIDYMMDDMYRGSLPIYMLYPFPVMELNLQSTIHSKENSARKRERNKELVRSGASQRQGAGLMEKLRMKYYNFRMDRLDKEALAAMRKGSISSIQLS
jgi:glycosyl transferase family 25